MAKTTELQDAQTARRFYADVGIHSTIPLEPNSRATFAHRWQHRPIEELWAEAKPHCNIGLRFPNDGLPIVAVDADDKNIAGTADNVRARLAGLGLQFLEYRTATGGARFVFQCPDAPALGKPDLAPDIGAGEFYISSGQVVLPWSRVDGKPYTHTAGNWHDIPSASWRDVSWLVPATATEVLDFAAVPSIAFSPEDAPASNIVLLSDFPVGLHYRPMPTQAQRLLAVLRSAPRHCAIGQYASTSEAEAAVVGQLALAGWTFDDIARVFHHEQPAHFASYKDARHAMAYLRRTWSRFVGRVSAHPTRQTLAHIYWAIANDADIARGRAGATNRAVLLAVIAQCWADAKLQTTASVRELAEAAGIGHGTAARALKRVSQTGRIQRVSGPSAADDTGRQDAAVWAVNPKILANGTSITVLSGGGGGADAGGSPQSMTLVPFARIAPAHVEVFSRGMLGKSAELVWAALDADKPQTVSQLARTTGKSWAGVRSALGKLQARELADARGRGWLRGTADLADVARDMGARSKADRKRRKHTEQRRRHRAIIANRKADRVLQYPQPLTAE